MKKISAFLLLVVLSFSTATALANPPNFSDIEDDWAKDAILAAVSQGIFSGNPDGTFAPQRAINRGEFAVVVTQALGLPPEIKPVFSFKDAWQIPSWAQEAVAAVVREGIMQGRGDGTFGPLTPVTREEAAVVLVRALGLTQEAETFRGKPGFTDDNKISPWALSFVAIARERGLFSGDTQGRFQPQQPLRRNEAAQVMLKCVGLAGNNGQGGAGVSSPELKATTRSNLNLRTGPSTKSTIILTLPQGTEVSVQAVENLDGETWLKVQYQGRVGYISAAYTSLTTTSPPREPEKSPPNDGNGYLLLATTTANLNVRTNPGVNSPRIGQLPLGTDIAVKDLVQYQGETWLQILYQGQKAYIAGEYTDIVAISEPPKKDTGGGQTGIEEPPFQDDPTINNDRDPGEQADNNTQFPSVPTAEIQYRFIDNGTTWGLRLVIPGKKVTMATLMSNLNVRKAPGEDSLRLGGLPAGTKVPVEQVITKGDEKWLKISFQGKSAYLAAWYTTLSQETQDAPAPGINEITLSRVNDSLYSFLVKGTHPLGGKLRTGPGRITLEIPKMEIPEVKRSLAPGPFSNLHISDNTIFLEHKLQQVDAKLGATGDGGLQVLLGISPGDDPNFEGSVDPESKGALKGKIIMLDAGHGGSDPGAIGPTYGTKEKDVVLPITLKTAALLEAQGARVILTRQQDRDVSLEGRVNLSNSHKPHLFVSIHADYNYNPATNGSTVYYSSANPRSQESSRLGVHIMDELAKNPGLRRVGVRDSKYYVLRNNTVPAVLVETAFLSYAPEEALLRQDSFQQKVAAGITAGILRYFQ